ncbi:MAG: AEC family transporter [Clostridia bacterium]|nr:AEC family transporter [Clostridia bacterium]
MIPLLLFYKILQLSVIMMFGFVLVKSKIIKSGDSVVLSKISLYLLMPAVIINSFDIEMTEDIMNGLALAFAGAFAIHIVFLAVDMIYKRVFNGTSVERASIIYPNAANLIIPIVSYVLGDEWVIYSCAFLSVQIFFIWTHGIQLFSTGEKLNFKKILLNINIIAIAIGVILMVSGIRLPQLVKDVSSSLGSMLGSVGMLIAGMLAAEIDFKSVLANKRLYLVLIMRMLICPLIILVMMKCVCSVLLINNAEKILLISFLASITPSAATVMQFAQINNKEVDFAVGINIITTVVCIVTMPVFVALYQI